MSNFGYNQRPPYMNQMAKKPRLGPRGPNLGPNHLENDGKRLLSFKEFILSQSDNIDEQEALKNYGDYKTDFIKRQIDKFFKDHEEEEWFRNKYRPIEVRKLEEATKKSKARRKDLFNQVVERGGLNNVTVDCENRELLMRFLDSFSLLLEGASFEEIESGEARDRYAVSAVYIPALHPGVDKSMIEEFAGKHPDFLRVAMSDADRQFNRKAWIVYKQMHHDSIKQMSWDLNAQKLGGHEIKSMVNKEMNDRNLYITHFWFCHADVAKADLKNVAKILSYYEGEDCPLLEEIKNYLIDETNEEEAALGLAEENDKGFEFTQNPELFKVLDKIILYLRVVHSYDYYSSTEFVGEDDMIRRVGIMFTRPRPPQPDRVGENPTEQLREFIEAQAGRVNSFISKPTLSEHDQKKLGWLDAAEKVENFVFVNIDEKVKDRVFICKLTGKRFKAHEFARKHMFNRCQPALDEVRMNVEFFNNYLADPRRPM